MEHLVGCRLPDIELLASDGGTINPARLSGTSVLFCYPFSGRPGYPNPPDWDDIPGAHGSTLQALGFERYFDEFERLSAKVFGLSFQDNAWQKEFVARTSLRVTLLSDHERRFAKALSLPTFRAGTEDFLQRITFVSKSGIVDKVRWPIDAPGNDACETLLMVG